MATAEPWTLQRDDLSPVIRELIGNPHAEVMSWETQQVGYARIDVAYWAIRRVTGIARVGNETITWRLIFKEARRPTDELLRWVVQTLELSAEEITLFEEVWNWDREPLAYASLLASLPGDLRAPRCYGVSKRNDGSWWLWLEGVRGADRVRWSHDDFARDARALGTFNGAYLAGYPLPHESWLNQRFLPVWCTVSPRVTTRLRRSPDTWQEPTIRRAFPVEVVERIERLWEDYPSLLARHADLPRTFCHQDSNRANLLLGRGAVDVIGIDWTYCGIGGLGEDAGQLLASSLLWNDADAARARDLEEAVVASYLDGLRAAGWTGDARLAWRSIALAAVLRWTMHAPRLFVTPGSIVDPFTIPTGNHPIEDVLVQRSTVTAYLLDLADRVRAELDEP
jgi:hypothetical protein